MATNIKPLHDRVIVRRIEEGNRFAAVSLFPTPQKRNRRKASSGAGDGKYKDDGTRQPLDVKKVIECCSVSTVDPRSRWMAKAPDHARRRDSGNH